MKVSKKILGAVLCGLIVVGGSNATVVKANAQTGWSMDVGFQTHTIGISIGRSYVPLTLVLDNSGNLKLQGAPRVAGNRTFSDTFRIGWRKSRQQNFESPIVFRQCWQADAGKALKNVVSIFNRAGIRVGDEIFIHGEESCNSVKFYNQNLIKKPGTILTLGKPNTRPYNPQCTLYENFPRHYAAFKVTREGLELVQENPVDGKLCEK